MTHKYPTPKKHTQREKRKGNVRFGTKANNDDDICVVGGGVLAKMDANLRINDWVDILFYDLKKDNIFMTKITYPTI